MNVKPLSTLQRVLTAGLARARLECASSAACPRLLLITLKFLQPGRGLLTARYSQNGSLLGRVPSYGLMGNVSYLPQLTFFRR